MVDNNSITFIMYKVKKYIYTCKKIYLKKSVNNKLWNNEWWI